uniref:CCR4-NOT transcription complex subunit 11 n=1 Tax=Meloidogyne incognita TaxID=6306 RepID=A0A914L310_MELIC
MLNYCLWNLLSNQGTSNELVHFCRKWFDENNDKLNFVEADRLLNQLVASQTSTSFTLAIVCCLFCKVTKVKTENELKDFLIGFDEVLPSFDVQQLHWAPDIYTRLLEFTTDLLIKKKVAIWGINLLKTSILIFAQGNSNWLTNIHPLLFCLCLKARYFDNIEPFLKIDVTQLLKQSYSAVSFQTNQQQQQIVTSTDNSNASTTQQHQQPPQSSTTTTAPTNSSSLTSTAVSFLQKAVNTVSGTFGNPKNDAPCNKPTLQTIVLFNRRSILLYFYYGALIYGALEKWEDSCLFLEYLITLPSKRCSSIILEGLKKYLIISLIIGRKKPLERVRTLSL